MKTLIFLFIILVSCVSQDNNGFEGLTDAEKSSLLLRQKTRCISDGQATLADLGRNFDELLRDLDRGNKWPISIKRDSTVTSSTTVHVWRPDVTNSTLYLVLTTTSISDTIPQYQFVKFKATENAAILTDALNKTCDKALYPDFSGSAGSSIQLKTYGVASNGIGTNKNQTTTTYSYPTTAPAFLAFGSFTTTEREVTVDNVNTSTATVNKSGTLGNLQAGDPTNTSNPDPAYKTYKEYYPNAGNTPINNGAKSVQFCVLTSTGGVYGLPYDKDFNCTTSDTAGPAGWAMPKDDL